jgi:hypothetical protein
MGDLGVLHEWIVSDFNAGLRSVNLIVYLFYRIAASTNYDSEKLEARQKLIMIDGCFF